MNNDYKTYNDLNNDFVDTSNIINEYLGCQAITNDGKLCNLKYEFKINDIDNNCELYCVNHIYNWIQKLFNEKYYILKESDTQGHEAFLNNKTTEFKIDEIIIKSKKNILNITNNFDVEIIKNFIKNNKIHEILLLNKNIFSNIYEVKVFTNSEAEKLLDTNWKITNEHIKLPLNIQEGKNVKKYLNKKIFDIYDYYIKKNIYKFKNTNNLQNDIENYYNNFINILDDKYKFELIFNQLKYELIKFNFIYFIAGETDVFLRLYNQNELDEYKTDTDIVYEIINNAYLVYTNDGFYQSPYVNNIITTNNNYLVVYCNENKTQIYKKHLLYKDLLKWLNKNEISFYKTINGIKLVDDTELEFGFAIFSL
jgi:hypothetical protein